MIAEQIEAFIPDGVAEVRGNLDEFNASGYVDGHGKWILAVPVDVVQAIAEAWREYVNAPLLEMSAKQSKLNRLLIALAEDDP